MINYDEMSDYDINREVAISLGINVPSESNPWLWKTEFCLHQLNGDGSKIEKTIVANYCNDPSVAWSIIVDNGISLVWMDAKVTYYEAHGINQDRADEDWHSQHPNPLRAAMICFLKMKDSEK